MSPTIEFLIHEALPGGQVTGRHCSGTTPLGQVFTALFRCDNPPRLSNGEHGPTPPRILVCPISLKLEAITMYGKNVDVLYPGLTALLTLSGEDFPLLEGLVAKVSDCSNHRLFLCNGPIAGTEQQP